LTRRISIFLVAAVATAGVGPEGVRDDCSGVERLPAYAHNDYRNVHPLQDALALGLRGVEADVVLVEGELRVAHERKEARAERTLESLYLRPLAARIERCHGRVYDDTRPFLLNVEIKEADDAAFVELRRLIGCYASILTEIRDGRVYPGAVDVVLVGHSPGLLEIEQESPRFYRVQVEIERPADLEIPWRADVVGFQSIDYGKRIRSRRSMQESKYLAAIREAKRAHPNCMIRVFNLPPERALYERLLGAGVDLIGTKGIERTHRILRRSGGPNND
jgi:hypothetical protein